MATTHSQLPAHFHVQDPEGSRSPFVLWEGGHERARTNIVSALEEPVLTIALEAEPLPLDFSPVPSRSEAHDDREDHATAPRRGITQSILFFALCLVTVLGFVAGSFAEGAELSRYRDSLSWEPHIVASGETLRSILDGRELPPVESGRLISWVEEMNELPDATIYAGQKLLMPEWHAGPSN